MATIEIHDTSGRRLARFNADVNPGSAEDCVALLRTQARALKKPLSELRLVTWVKGRIRTEYRA
jgi:hypothetical protein